MTYAGFDFLVSIETATGSYLYRFGGLTVNN
jgi:hypothetical protein